ncbi:hypothetical protein BDV37DRAFT_277205 [Aspergillus pseudonomiae]|uniref:Uncharacterized protein n=1 Tax=Aspergillus pseudonomiae TaxID=1506151 RepID=A0A5N7CSE2_9EURO|nr:uncharacterized protein BDV37DRAFT_277205 [Aspergillus pseudonomiae]KAE8397064.1 hypothetical protein BDV37DRAFT_277205 [Aspergillus pseudonomiae]
MGSGPDTRRGFILKKKKAILAGGAKLLTHSYLDNNHNHGRISFSVCAVLHQIHSGHGAVPIPVLSATGLASLYIVVPLFPLDQDSQPPLGNRPMHPWQQSKILVGSGPVSDRLGEPERLAHSRTTAGGESTLLCYPVRGPVNAGRCTSPRDSTE